MQKWILTFALLSCLTIGCSGSDDDDDSSASPSPVVTSPTPEPVTPTPTVSPTPPLITPTPEPCHDCDGDLVEAPADCDDTNAAIYPGAVEILCDGIDQDCDDHDGTVSDNLVCLDGSCRYSTIAKAISSAPDFSTIQVCPGTYQEANLQVDDGALAVKSVAGPTQTIIDGGGKLQSVFRFFQGGNTGTYGIDGFTLKGGKPLLFGGGFYSETSSPYVRNCIIENNTAGQLGAGVYLVNSSPTFSHCIIRNNASSIDGGGIFAGIGAPIFDNVIIENNAAVVNGGGISMDGSSPTFRNCVFRSNSASKTGGAVEMQSTSFPKFYNSLFVGNYSPSGNVVYFNAYNAHPSFFFSVMVGNGSTPSLSLAPMALPGAVVIDSGDITIQNSIMAYNAGCNVSVASSTVDLTFSSLYASSGGCNANGFTLAASNWTDEPGFYHYNSTSALPDDYHLALTSPLIDKGTGTSLDGDGSAPDPGIYGGASGIKWDLDQDGLPAYFWPGGCTDAPVAVTDPSLWDCDDTTFDAPSDAFAPLY